MNQEIENAIAEHEKRLDELFFQLSDVLDVKASIILVVISFLGAISGQVLVLHDLPFLIRSVQMVAVLALAGGVFATVRSLWPRIFDAPPDTAEWISYLQELENHYEGEDNASELVAKDFMQAIARRRQERIAKNRALTTAKSNLNDWAFRGTVVAVAAQAVSLIWMAFWHLLK
jgi:hypothetical protein